MEINYIDVRKACYILGCSDRTLLRYRQQNKLLQGIHWGRNPSGKVLYNQQLLENLVICGGEIAHPDHQKLIDRCLADRPENQKKKQAKYPVTVAG